MLLLFADLLVSTTAAHARRPGAAGAERRPLLAPWWRVVEDGDRLLFEHAGHVVQLNGRAVRALLPALVPLLDGAHTEREIVQVLGDAAEAPVAKALTLLDDHGLLVDGPATQEDAAASYVASVCSVSPRAASAALARAHVAIVGSAPAGAELARLLGSGGKVTVTRGAPDACDLPASSGPDVIVAAPLAEEVTHLAGLNERCLRDARPWLVVLPTDGRLATVGPLYVPPQTACHACYILRRGATSGFEQDFPHIERRPVRAPMPPAASTIAAGLAALVCLRWLAARDPTLPGALYALELDGTVGLTRHRVLRVPRCPACGVPSPPPSPWFRELDA